MSGRIHVFPAWESNPYLNMLYVGARSQGWQIDGSKTVNALASAIPDLGRGDILHIHWTSPVLHHSDNLEDARRALERFDALLSGLKEAGGHLIWTVHNSFAHDARYPDLEVELARLLSDKADRIVQLNRHTREVVAGYYDLPVEKLVTLRHASYAGVYASPPSQYSARQRLGIPASAAVVGFVGQIRRYKGVPTLLHAMGRAARSVEDLTLVLAGKTPPEDIAQIELDVPPGLPVVRDHSFISDSDIAMWFSACDVMVFPYERVLNSGSVLLSATFGRPCILPAEPHLVAEYGDQPWVSFYEPDDDPSAALAAAIPAALSKGDGARVSARQYAAEYTTRHMTWDYVTIIEAAVGDAPSVSGVTR